MRSSALRSALRLLARFSLQASLWAVLTLAIAAMLELAGSMDRTEAFRFSAANWLPWALLTPGVFWLSQRFPLERGHLARSIPVHLAAAAGCTAILLWVAATFTPLSISRGPVSPAGPGGPGGRGGPSAPELRPGLRGGPPPDFGPGPMGGGRGPGRAPPRPRNPLNISFITLALRANVGFAIYLIVAAAAHARTFYRRAQDRDRQALALVAGLNQAKLDALRLQLQPHFLFNTLNAISTLVHRDAAAADQLIGDLSELLRLSLQTTTHEVSLTRELELLEHYLSIEQARLGDRLRIVRNIDPVATPALVPTLLLQPLAENAVRHGIEPRVSPGTLVIQARRKDDRLLLSVSDDGVGLAPASSNPARRGIGLSNTEERLHALHGDDARLVIVNPSEGGTRVEITLPFRTEPRPMPTPTA